VHHVTAHVLVLNGPNLNLLGTREPEVYGRDTLADIESELHSLAQARGARVDCFQTNHEGALIDRIHAARAEQVDMIVINAGAWTHSSIAVRDALAAVAIPFIEVHLTNVHGREPFRHRSLLADRAIGTIVGLGPAGYRYALQYALDRWSR
jgi:3-dehydroquinate dehydratase II